MSLINELYKFTIGATSYGFAPRIKTTTYLGIDYKPTIITRGRVKITENLLKNTLTVTFPRTHSFARDLLKNLSDEIVKFTLYRNGNVYWQGIVISAEARGVFIELSCVSSYSKTLRPAITPKITLTCRHTLYGSGCNVVKALYAVTSTIANVDSSGTTITMGAISQPDGYFLLGEINYGSQKRMITKHVGTTIKILSPFNSVPVGTVTLYPGCAHTEAVCASKFNNLNNYGGFSKIPTRDPHNNQGLL